MKLDSIIYDTNTLASTISEKLQNESPTFKAMYPSETSTALVNLLAGYGSMLQYTIVSSLANCYTDTAFSPSAIYQLAETLGNRLHGNVSSKLYCNITRTNLKGKSNVVIPSNSVFQVEGLPFFNDSPIVFPRDINVVNNVLLTQGEYVTVEEYTSGVAGEKIYFSSDFKCNMNMVKVFINETEWDTAESFLPLNSMTLIDPEQAQTVLLKMSPDGRAYIKFGNNSNGALPVAGSKVRIEYVSNEGENGNIEKNNMNIQLMTPIYVYDNSVNTLLTVDITSAQPSYGGYNTQSLEVLRESSPYIFASGNRAVRRDDYKALLLNKCGYISANVWGEYEEAEMHGGYDKIMMNMVYYTGIKEIQQYDYRPIGGLDLGETQDVVSEYDPILFSNVLGNIKGFRGSYEIDLMNKLDDSSYIRYSDKKGNGILVCDPSDNGEWKIDANELYPYNDSYELYKTQRDYFSAECLQPVDDSEGNSNDARYLFDISDPNEFHSSGCYSDGESGRDYISMKIGFDSPLQINIMFPQPTAISMFAFKTPKDPDDIGRFPGNIAVYACDDPAAETENIKNNSEWTRIVEMQKLHISGDTNEWSDWVTTELYNPNDTTLLPDNGWKKFKRYVIEIYTLQDQNLMQWGEEATDIGKCFIGKMKFMLDKMKSDRYAWGMMDANEDNPEVFYTVSTEPPQYAWKKDDTVIYTVSTTFSNVPSESYKKNVYNSDGYEIGTVSEWSPELNPSAIIVSISSGDIESGQYTRYIASDKVTEKQNKVYNAELHLMCDNGGEPLVLTGIKKYDNTYYYLEIKDANGNWISGETPSTDSIHTKRNESLDLVNDNKVLDHKTSTIDYENNSLVDLCIPKLRDDMKCFEYIEEISGLTAANGYRTGDVLYYAFDNGLFANIKVTNINIENGYVISINSSKGALINTEKTQTGNQKLEVSGVDLQYTYGFGSGSGAKLTITSNDNIGVYGTFTGNAYSTATAQNVDSPIIEEYNHFTTYMEFKQPRVKNVQIEVSVEYKDSYNYKDTKKKVEEAIYSVFNITPFYVGKSLNVADIWEAINNVAGVKRFIVKTPVDNIECEPYEFITLQQNDLIINDIFNEEFK